MIYYTPSILIHVSIFWSMTTLLHISYPLLSFPIQYFLPILWTAFPFYLRIIFWLIILYLNLWLLLWIFPLCLHMFHLFCVSPLQFYVWHIFFIFPIFVQYPPPNRLYQYIIYSQHKCISKSNFFLSLLRGFNFPSNHLPLDSRFTSSRT